MKRLTIKIVMIRTRPWVLFLIVLCCISSGCQQQTIGKTPTTPLVEQQSYPTPTETIQTPKETATYTPTSITLTVAPTISVTSERDGCRQPAEDYDRMWVNGHQLNQRTFEMLDYAATLYKGLIDITGSAITQGSYTSAVAASFGTHSGGGAVDLSVMEPGTYTILVDDIELLIQALRLAGFAAWYRDFNDLYPGSPVHIHAIAIGDRELSLAAREQLTGPHGYFWGYNGLPIDGDLPIRDPHGGPIVCNWMIERGYPNKTATPSP